MDQNIINKITIENFPSTVEIMAIVDKFKEEKKLKEVFNTDIRSNVINLKIKHSVKQFLKRISLLI